MLMFVVVLVVCTSIAEAHFARESGLSQDLERSIDGSLADGRIFFFHESIEIFIRQVLFSAQKNIQDQVALRRAFQSLFWMCLRKTSCSSVNGSAVGHW